MLPHVLRNRLILIQVYPEIIPHCLQKLREVIESEVFAFKSVSFFQFKIPDAI